METEIRKTFSIEDIIASSWRLTWANLGTLVLVTFIAFMIYAAVHLFTNSFIQPIGNVVGSFLAGLINTIVGCLLGIGLINVSLKVTNLEPISVGDMFSKLNLFINYFICTIIENLVVGIGLILLIIPGIFFLVRFSLGLYVLVDRDLGPIEALQRSWKIVRGCSWKVLGLILVCLLIDFVGLCLLVVGLLVTIPITIIAFALLYRELEAQTFKEVVHTPEVEIIP